MTEKTILIIVSIIVIIVFSANFWDKWINYNYEYLKDKKQVWFWFRVFNIKESKENFKLFFRTLSAIVIIIMVITIMIAIFDKEYQNS